MFIPPGETIHENLATSYVLVEALVADLCEGGFSGVVEVVLRETNGFIVIASGNVAAVFDKSGDDATYAQTTVAELAERSRRERGRVSIYGYPPATASAVAGRINAKTLYSGLSTEFTDLEKMIGKLVRERDREWFIEINTDSGPGALIHIRDLECRIVGSADHSDSGALDLASNPALGRLIDECNRASGTFDVYFTQAAAEPLDARDQTSPERIPVSLPGASAIVNEETIASQLADHQHTASGPLMPNELRVDSAREPEQLVLSHPGEPGVERTEQLGVSTGAVAAVAGGQSKFAAPAETATPGLAEEFIEPRAGDLLIEWDEIPAAGTGADAMTEIKRLMAEIARAIEEAAQAVGRPDSFSMSLRASQLKIADRFPFLDPFAGEFEYLAGEIVFVGHAAAEEFVAGLTEALKLAVEAVTLSTAYSDRFRSYVIEDLQKLLARERAGLERLGLDQVIEQIITVLL